MSLNGYDEIKDDIANIDENKAEKDEIPTELSQLSQDSTHRVVSDTEKSTWNGKLDSSAVTHETWTFTLDDGTVVTKEVSIWISQS